MCGRLTSLSQGVSELGQYWIRPIARYNDDLLLNPEMLEIAFENIVCKFSSILFQFHSV